MTPLPERIETRRLVLRVPTDRDIPQIVREIGNWNVARWLGRVPHPYVPRHARQWLANVRKARVDGRDLSFAIALAAKPERLIGVVGCHHLERASPILGYWLAESQWGKGYMSEAVAGVLDALFRTKPKVQPLATAITDNRGSIAVLEKAGFRRQRQPQMHANMARGHEVKVAVLKYRAETRTRSPEPTGAP